MKEKSTIPAVSIVIPIFDRIELLMETLESIRKQTFSKYEVLLVYDGSTIENLRRIQRYIEVIEDPRFILKIKPKELEKGANSSRVFGLQNSRGAFVKWFDSDDLMEPTLLEKQFQSILNHGLDGIFVNCGVYNEDCSLKIKESWRNKVFSEKPLEDYLKTQLAWPTPAGLWKKSSISHIRPFSQDVKNGQEWIFHLFVLTSNLKVGVIDEELIKIRSHTNSVSSRKTPEYTVNRMRSRAIGLSRLLQTRNSGALLVLKSLTMMTRSLSLPYLRKVFLAVVEDFKAGGIPVDSEKIEFRLKKITPEIKSLKNDFHNNTYLQQSAFALEGHTECNKPNI